MTPRLLGAIGLACLIGAQVFVAKVLVPMRAELVPAGVRVEGEKASAVYESIQPGEFAGTLLLGGFRGLASDLVWMRADAAKESGRFYESVALFQTITRIQPRFEQIWEFIAAEMVYNLAFEAEDTPGKWAWFVAGIQANAEGCRRNPQSERLLRNLAWLFHHKGDAFQERIEAYQWGVLAQVLETVNSHLPGDQHLASPQRGDSTFAIAAQFYRACLRLSDALDLHPPSYLRRMIAIVVERDGNIERNRGHHREALRRYVNALETWEEVRAWHDQPSPSGSDEEADKTYSKESYGRNRGRLRRKVQFVASRLAPDAAGATAFSAALDAKRWDDARALIAPSTWRDSVEHVRIKWQDEVAPALVPEP